MPASGATTSAVAVALEELRLRAQALVPREQREQVRLLMDGFEVYQARAFTRMLAGGVHPESAASLVVRIPLERLQHAVDAITRTASPKPMDKLRLRWETEGPTGKLFHNESLVGYIVQNSIRGQRTWAAVDVRDRKVRAIVGSPFKSFEEARLALESLVRDAEGGKLT